MSVQAIILMFVVVLCSNTFCNAYALTKSEVSSATTAIQSAFVSTHNAEESGGNVSGLVRQLNDAIQLVQKAEDENSSNPLQAAADIQAAVQEAHNIVTESKSIKSIGTVTQEILYIRSIASAITIIVAAVLIYIFGGRVFRKIWLRMYGNFVVKPSHG